MKGIYACLNGWAWLFLAWLGQVLTKKAVVIGFSYREAQSLKQHRKGARKMFDSIVYDDYSNSAIFNTGFESIQFCFESDIEPEYNGLALTDNSETRIY